MTDDPQFWMALLRTIAALVVMTGSIYYWWKRLKQDKKSGKKT